MIKEYIGTNATISNINSDIIDKITIEIKYDFGIQILLYIVGFACIIVLLIMLEKYCSYLKTKIEEEYKYKKLKLEKDDNFRRDYLNISSRDYDQDHIEKQIGLQVMIKDEDILS